MSSVARYFQVRIRSDDDTTNVLTLSSYPGGTNPYLTGAPQGSGLEVNVLQGTITYGEYTVSVADAITAGTDRVVTELLADAGGHYDLLGRVAVIDTSPDGAVWTPRISGFLQSVRFPTAILVELAIGDSLRIDRRRDVFKTITPNFRAATAIVGGPVVGGFGFASAFDHGKWRMKVGTASGTTVRLDFVYGPVPVTNSAPFGAPYASKQSPMDSATILLLDNRAAPHRMIRDGGHWFPGLEAHLTEVGTSTVVITTPIVGEGVPAVSATFVPQGRLYIDWPASLGSLPAVNTQYDVTVQPTTISQDNPLHVEGHPVDILTELWEEAAIAWDTTSAAAVKAIIGPNVYLLLRITGPWKLATFQQDVLFKPFQFAFRPSANGERVLFSTRLENAAPSATLASTDLLGNAEDQPVLFEIEDRTTLRAISVTEQIFTAWHQTSGVERPPDTIIVNSDTVVVEREGATEEGEEISIVFPGSVGTVSSSVGYRHAMASGIISFAYTLSRALFPRFGFGCPTSEFLVTDSVTAQVGEEMVLSLAHQVNGTVRGGTRLAQIVKRTERLAEGGVLLRFLDSGANQASTPVPTFTIAASGTSPKTHAVITLTNAAALSAAGNDVLVEWGTGGVAPATGATLTLLDPATDTTLTTPRVDSGSYVWVRLRSQHGEQRPSAWSAWQGVNLTDLTAPSGLSQLANVLSWTTGEGPQEVLWRPATESVDRSLGLLPAGATYFDLTSYVPTATSIVATVRSRDALPYGGVSTSVTLTFTTGSAPSLTAPSSLTADRVGIEDDELNWTAPSNPTGTVTHIERSTTSPGVAGFSEVDSFTDSGLTGTRTLVGSFTTNTYYRVRNSYLGVYTSYSNTATLAL